MTSKEHSYIQIRSRNVLYNTYATTVKETKNAYTQFQYKTKMGKITYA